MANEAGTVERRHENTRFERSDLSPRTTVGILVGVLVGMWIVTGLIYFYFAYLSHHRANVSPPPLPIEAHGNPMPPEPRLQESPRQDLKAMRTREDWRLSHYFWIDKGKGILAIPVDRAIEIIAQRGIPPQKQSPNIRLSQPQAGTRLTGFEGNVEPEPR